MAKTRKRRDLAAGGAPSAHTGEVPAATPSGFPWTFVVVAFLAGLLARGVIFRIPHEEVDELIYTALLEQLDAGKGYTLQGHPILDQPFLSKAQYDHPLFYHPPGGILIFRAFTALFGPNGLGVAQLAAYATFFVWTLVIAWVLLGRAPPGAFRVVAALAAFQPLVVHVTSRLWLDGPYLALATAGAAVFLLGVSRRRLGIVALGGALAGCAGLVKAPALLVIPGALAVAHALVPPAERRFLLRAAALFAVLAAALQLPWMAWQAKVLETPFVWAGKPDQPQGAPSAYMRYITELSPFTYLHQLPRITWSLAPALAVLLRFRNDARVRGVGRALLLWAAFVVGVHVLLGFFGYAKLLRYVLLSAPATVVLAGLAFAVLADALAERRPPAGSFLLALLLGAGVLLEVVQAVKTPFRDNLDLIVPLFGGLPRA